MVNEPKNRLIIVTMLGKKGNGEITKAKKMEKTMEEK